MCIFQIGQECKGSWLPLLDLGEVADLHIRVAFDLSVQESGDLLGRKFHSFLSCVKFLNDPFLVEVNGHLLLHGLGCLTRFLRERFALIRIDDRT